MIDPKNLPKVYSFSGEEAMWLEWSFGFRSYMLLLGLGGEMNEIKQRGPPDPAILTQQQTANSQFLFHFLVQLLKGKARRLAMKTRFCDGYLVARSSKRVQIWHRGETSGNVSSSFATRMER